MFKKPDYYLYVLLFYKKYPDTLAGNCYTYKC
jgi:hypothetical protein